MRQQRPSSQRQTASKIAERMCPSVTAHHILRATGQSALPPQGTSESDVWLDHRRISTPPARDTGGSPILAAVTAGVQMTSPHLRSLPLCAYSEVGLPARVMSPLVAF